MTVLHACRGTAWLTSGGAIVRFEGVLLEGMGENLFVADQADGWPLCLNWRVNVECPHGKGVIATTARLTDRAQFETWIREAAALQEEWPT